MLRIEKIFEEDGIQSELDAYNPLCPDGSNFKATMLIEYANVADRKAALAKLIGIEDRKKRYLACIGSCKASSYA